MPQPPGAPLPPVLTNTGMDAASAPPLIGGPTPPPRSSGRRFVAVALSLCLFLFIADGVVSLADDILTLLLKSHLLSPLRGVAFFFSILAAIFIYALMACTPLIPKRFFLPIALFNPFAALAIIPVLIFHQRAEGMASLVISICQILLGVAVLVGLRGGRGFGMPLVSENQLSGRGFSWLNLSVFILANIFVLAPVVLAYVFFCASLGIGHLTEGFVSLRPGGLTLQARTYVRDDGKTVELVPMAHVADASFYRKVSSSFPTNSVVLMEGVTDHNHLLTNTLSYKRMAKSLGVAEQQKEFKPSEVEVTRADVDIGEFSPETIALLNVAMLLYSKGINIETLTKFSQFAPPPGFERQLWDDILHKRNRHLLEEMRARLTDTDTIVLPWGAAHMPELSHEIQKMGFRLKTTRDYRAIGFFKGS